MLYCEKCKVYVSGQKTACPLCQNELSGAFSPEEEIFPKLKKPKYSGHFLMRLITFIAIAAAVIFGFAFLGQYFLTPAAIFCIIPAVMLRNRFTAVLLNIFISALWLFAAYFLTYGVQKRSKEEKA